MHIQRRRLHAALAQHDVDLSPMVCLMIEHVQHGWNGRFFVMHAFAVRIGQSFRQETCGCVPKEFFHCDIVLLPGGP